MTKALEAVFDGTVLHPTEPLELEPNTRVRIVVDTADTVETVETLPDVNKKLALLREAVAAAREYSKASLPLSDFALSRAGAYEDRAA